ncbi:histone-fold-containing protein [Apodospora peruviana]|uniref:Histone-fold-containing protein n=1 Tax=Apodospora peruviana TaxID=516989 RepID=A0AAE0I512_9PEZI|nr:histone-fold-containing protein [Apodospora peruviana]
MPYNTTAIPPRKEVTGQTQLPLTRVKKIIAVDPDITICSNNAAFVITLATEMFIQHLATEAQNMAKLERKPRRNIQYKDLATAVHTHDNLEFLEDVVPKVATFKHVKSQAAATRAKLNGEKSAANNNGDAAAAAGEGSPLPNGSSKKAKVPVSAILNGTTTTKTNGFISHGRGVLSSEEDPNAQLELEMRQAQQLSQQPPHDDGDVDMIG